MTKKTGTGKHVLKDGVWVRSPELASKARAVEYKRAGVSGLLAEGDTDQLRGATTFANRRISFPAKKPGVLWIHGGEMSPKREASVSYILRRYVDAGLQARRFRLTELIDRWMDPDKAELRALKRELADAKCFVMEMSNEAGNKMAPQVALEVLATRRGQDGLTVCVSSDDVSVQPARYGPEVAAAFKSIKASNRYLEV
jgi:hypothetical protein